MCFDFSENLVGQLVGRQNARAVAGMYARLLDMLHDTGHNHGLPVADGVHVHFNGGFQKLVYEDGPFR
ncbi:MAG: hypothetical protein BWX80_04022 [Candidatus Hydrogenedentes bacterium ADurb.Bin101]|nr:MAG: hypothetical protein BWX80_04022 [Candidatus Hydrogenedentes bacterium ADurb.Bin101]